MIMNVFDVIVSEGTPARMRLCGEFDMAGVTLFESMLRELDGDVEIDCSGLQFIDAAGFGSFVAAHNDCEGRGSVMILVNPSPWVQRLLRVVGLDDSLDVRQTDAAP